MKDRLTDAYTNHLSSLEAADVPDRLRQEFESMCDAMHREPSLPRENPVRASVRKMSNDEANQYAALVVKMFGAVALASQPLASPAHRTPTLAPIVQLFAADG